MVQLLICTALREREGKCRICSTSCAASEALYLHSFCNCVFSHLYTASLSLLSLSVFIFFSPGAPSSNQPELPPEDSKLVFSPPH